ADSATPSTPATASTASGASFDRNAARAEILGADSAFVRAILAKKVDSLMPYYDQSVVSMSEGAKAVKGLGDLRTSYTEAVKGNTTDITFQSGGGRFFDAGKMVWAYGNATAPAQDWIGKGCDTARNLMHGLQPVGGH